jgi:Zn-dependent peptidase ImmA (M78 family)/DNA-binding XRE family transcriptional regulator
MQRNFNRKRLTVARQKRGLTKKKLADATNITTRSITAYENGDNQPTGERLTALSNVLQFPLDFFFASDVELPDLSAVSFRALSSMTARKRDAALAAGTLAVELSKWIDERYVLPECDVLDLHDGTPEAAAIKIRNHWGIGVRPIKNTVHLLESKGVRVFSLAEECHEVDAFSFWRNDTPYVFLNTQKSAEHSRFDAMHELGHLILHRHGGPSDNRKAEKEADEFASAMLMPLDDLLANAPKFITLQSLIKFKKRWTVSVAALAYRLHDVDFLSDWKYRTICIQMSQSGYRKSEPDPSARESSQLLKIVFDALKEEGFSRRDMANELNIRLEDLEGLIFGLVMTTVAGGNDISGSNAKQSRKHLRIV